MASRVKSFEFFGESSDDATFFFAHCTHAHFQSNCRARMIGLETTMVHYPTVFVPEFINASPSKTCSCTTVINEDGSGQFCCVPFDVVVLFGCSHVSVAERLVRRYAVFVYVLACSHAGMSFTPPTTGLACIPQRSESFVYTRGRKGKTCQFLVTPV